MTNMKETVEKEIEEFRQKYGEEWGDEVCFFNNFAGNLPFGWRREGDSSRHNAQYANKGACKRLQGMTYAEFYQDIDDTILEIDLDLNELERLQKNRDPDQLEKLYKFTLPLYIRLREKGYNHYPDLIA